MKRCLLIFIFTNYLCLYSQSIELVNNIVSVIKADSVYVEYERDIKENYIALLKVCDSVKNDVIRYDKIKLNTLSSYDKHILAYNKYIKKNQDIKDSIINTDSLINYIQNNDVTCLSNIYIKQIAEYKIHSYYYHYRKEDSLINKYFDKFLTVKEKELFSMKRPSNIKDSTFCKIETIPNHHYTCLINMTFMPYSPNIIMIQVSSDFFTSPGRGVLDIILFNENEKIVYYAIRRWVP